MPAMVPVCSDHIASEAEQRRLAALERLDLLDMPHEEALDRIAGLIRRIFGVEVALISLLDAHRQWFMANVGLTADQTPRRDTFCKHVVQSAKPLIVTDASRDPRFCGNPLVVAPRGIRFYAGVPLQAETGEVIGSVCAVGHEPRQWSEQENEILVDLASTAMDLLKLRRLAAVDALTGILARRTFFEEGERAARLADRHNHALSCIVFDLDHFKSINDRLGHAAGDSVLRSAVAACLADLRKSDIFGRVGGEEFAIVLPQTSISGAMDVAERLRSAIASRPVDVGGRELKVTASFGVSGFDRDNGELSSLLAAADHAMYLSKTEGRNRCSAAGPVSDRRRVLHAGSIVFGDRASAVDCTVRLLGSDGAGLDVADTDGLPDRFVLAIGPERTEKACVVTARTARHLDVDFV